MGNAPTVDERSTFRLLRATLLAGGSAGVRVGLVVGVGLADMVWDSFLVVRGPLAVSASRSHGATGTWRKPAVRHKNGMSRLGKNQGTARLVQVLTTRTIDVSSGPLDLRQWSVS